MSNFIQLKKRFFMVPVVIILFSFVFTSCQEPITEPSHDLNGQNDEIILSKNNPLIRAAIEVQERNTASLMKLDDVVGTAVGLTEDGRPALLILTKTDVHADALAKGSPSHIPQSLENLPTRILVVGELKAMKGKPGGGVSHTAKQTTPIQLGTSGGWRYDLANGYCCGGTLGALISRGGNQFILSNYHVLEADIVNGGNSRTASSGDFVIQPGLIDINCNAANGQDVATLSGIKSLPGSNVDAAIAQVIPGKVRSDGAILEVGTISSSTIGASINQTVKKSGRTTGLTRSKISGLNATVSITYDNECAGGTSFTKTFTGQIVIANKGSKFLNSGDSGSLLVEDVATNPKAIGLLYAGSSFTAIANPIGDVLNFFNATMVGQ